MRLARNKWCFQHASLWRRSGVVKLLVSAMLLVSCQRATMAAEPAVAPFVPGFERFARHREIDSVLGGQLLLSELSCTACHAAQVAELKPKLGPVLSGAGNRLDHAWLARFIASPQTVKPGTTMPEVLGNLPEGERQAAVRALVAFLGSLHRSFPKIKGTGAMPVPNEFWNLGDARQGQRLFHRIGCVACHEPDEEYETVETKPTPLDAILEQLDPDELQELGLASTARRVESVPLGDLSAKTTRKALAYFLLDPHRVRTAGRMPDFQLGVVEAADLAAWLLRDRSSSTERARDLGIGDPDIGNPMLIAKGRQLFRDLGCANCHEADAVGPGRKAKSLAKLDLAIDSHCFRSARRGIPSFPLDKQQAEAVQAAIRDVVPGGVRGPRATGSNATSPPARDATETDATPAGSPATAARHAQLVMLRLNCVACHERDGQGGVGRYRRPYFETYGNVDIGDEGRLPPPLTGVGRKLQPAWWNRVMQGAGRVRSHMRIRMPVFPVVQVATLQAAVALADEVKGPADEKEVLGKQQDLAEAGRALLDTGCVQCHPLRGNALPGVVGVDLEGIASRVQPRWFRDFLLNPASLKPRTRMPTFFPDGKSQNAKILDGDTRLQVAALWAYLKGANDYPLPAKIEQARSQSYELIPRERPLILRTFMEEAGNHAIAVGFPEKVHFAFDAERIRVAQAWRGRFLDAEGTWFVRFAPPAQPLGTEQIKFPRGVPLAILDNANSPWPSLETQRPLTEDSGYRYQGHRLDEAGVPTFLYRVEDFEIEDRLMPDGRQLVRHVKISTENPEPTAGSLWLRGHVGTTLKHLGPLSYESDTGLRVSVRDVSSAGELRRVSEGTEWIIPLSFERQTTIEVRYQW